MQQHTHGSQVTRVTRSRVTNRNQQDAGSKSGCLSNRHHVSKAVSYLRQAAWERKVSSGFYCLGSLLEQYTAFHGPPPFPLSHYLTPSLSPNTPTISHHLFSSPSPLLCNSNQPIRMRRGCGLNWAEFIFLWWQRAQVCSLCWCGSDTHTHTHILGL